MDTLVVRLGLALAIGLLVGLERGWRERDAPAGSRTAGFRTYGLAGLLGGIMAAVATAMASPAVFAIAFLGFGAIFAWFSLREAIHDESFSVTGVIAGLGVFGLGGLAVAGDQVAAAAAGVALVGLLASREVLHGLLRKLSWVELRSALLLLGMTAIGLPLMPDRAIDPWGGVNPWEIWLFTVLTAGISYAGYIAVRVLGPQRGILVSGLAGALVSSTAVTLAFARRARSGEPARPLSAGACLAAMVSVLRVTAIVALVKPVLALAMAPALAAAAIVFGGAALILLRRAPEMGASEAKLGNPFDLGPILFFAASYAIVAAASAGLTGRLGSSSVILTSALSGTFDVDVAALTTARLIGEVVSVEVAAVAVLLAILLNATARLVVAFSVGPLGYALPLALATGLAALAGGGAHLLATG